MNWPDMGSFLAEPKFMYRYPEYFYRRSSQKAPVKLLSMHPCMYATQLPCTITARRDACGPAKTHNKKSPHAPTQLIVAHSADKPLGSAHKRIACPAARVKCLVDFDLHVHTRGMF